MKKLLVVLALVCAGFVAPAVSWGANGVGVHTSGNTTGGAGTTQSLTLTGVTAGSAIVAVGRQSSGSSLITGFADGASNNYTQKFYTANAAASFRLFAYYLCNAPSGSNTVTITTSSTGVNMRWALVEITGAAASACSPDTPTSSNYTTTTTPSTGTLTTSVANEMLVAALSADASVTTIVPGGSEAEQEEVDARFQVQTRLVTTATGYTSSWTMGSTQPGTAGMIAIVPAVATSPTLTSCSVTSTSTTGYTIGCTSNTSSTLYALARKKGSTASANCAAVIAHSGSLANNSASIGSGSVSISLTGLDYPTHDLDVCSSNGSGSTSVVSLTNQFKTAPSGKQYVTFGTLNSGSTTDPSPYYLLNANYSAGIASGDILEAGLTVLPSGNTLTITTTGDVSFLSDGSRQYDTERIYDVSAQGWILDATSSASFLVWFNNKPPTAPIAGTTFIKVPGGSAMTPKDLRTYCTDPEGDAITVTALDALPTGLSIASSVLSGTATTNGVYQARFRCTDATGDFSDIN